LTGPSHLDIIGSFSLTLNIIRALPLKYWLTYWSCFGILFLITDFIENFIGFIPGFYTLTIAATVYLMLPLFRGADTVSRAFTFFDPTIAFQI
jgi:hypothetical protein